MDVNLLAPLAVPLVLAAVAHLVVAALLPVHLVVLVVADEAVPFRQSGPESRLVSACHLKERSCQWFMPLCSLLTVKQLDV